jgi:hypothetical protein
MQKILAFFAIPRVNTKYSNHRDVDLEAKKPGKKNRPKAKLFA